MYILFGFISGVIGGMGMGGGTLLTPLLSFTRLPQRAVQAVNLVSFLPMCATALIFHARHGLVEKAHILWIVLPAVAFAAVGAWVAVGASDGVLRCIYALFLLGVGMWQLVRVLSADSEKKEAVRPR